MLKKTETHQSRYHSDVSLISPFLKWQERAQSKRNSIKKNIFKRWDTMSDFNKVEQL